VIIIVIIVLKKGENLFLITNNLIYYNMKYIFNLIILTLVKYHVIFIKKGEIENDSKKSSK